MQLPQNFLKVIKGKVSDCSNPIQLRALLNQYQTYVFSPEIREVFEDRIQFFKEKFAYDQLFESQLEDLEHDLDIDVQIAKVCKRQNAKYNDDMKRIVRSNQNNQSTEEREFLIRLFKQYNGEIGPILKFLKLDNDQFKEKLRSYNLTETLHKIRRQAIE